MVPFFLLGGFHGPHWPWALSWVLLVVGVGLILGLRLRGEAKLSSDGRLCIQGRGPTVHVDVREITEVSVPIAALFGFGAARVRWRGGSFRLSTNMRYLSGPADLTRLHPGRWSTEGFRDLVYRMYQINPEITIRRLRPPSWVPPSHWYQTSPPRKP